MDNRQAPENPNMFRYCDVDGDGVPVSHITWVRQIETPDPNGRPPFIGILNTKNRYPVSAKTNRFPMPIPMIFDTPIMAELYKSDMLKNNTSEGNPENWTVSVISVYGMANDTSKPVSIPVCRMRILQTPCPFCGTPLIAWHNIELRTGEYHKAYVHHGCSAKNGETCLILIDQG